MRILTLHPAATEMLFAIGAGCMIVGRCDGCDYPAAALAIPSIGDANEMTPERAAILEPDLVVLGPGQDHVIERLAALRPVTLRFAGLEESLEEIRSLARMIGKDVEADVLVHDLRTELDRVKERVARYHRVRVYAETSHAPWGTSRLVNEIVEIAGGAPIAGTVTIEDLKRFDPQVIIVSVQGEGGEFDPDMIAARDGWRDLAAVRGERVFVIDDALLHRPGPRLAQGAKLIAKSLHGA